MRLLIICISLFTSLSLFAQMSPVQGDDLITALGQRKSSLTSRDLLNYAGANGNPRGIKLDFIDNKLARIELYNDDNPWGNDIRQFRGGLPKNLSFDDDIKTAKQKLGNGSEEAGNVESNFYVLKNYPLKTGDTCQVNLEFINGRLINVALIYLKGTGDGPNGEVYVFPITGDDYLVMIKKNAYNKQFGTLLSLLGYSSYKDRTTLVYDSAGVEILFNKYQQVEWLNFYSGGTSQVGAQRMLKCELPLPLNLNFGENESAVVSKIGPPAARDGNKLVYNIEYARVYVTMSGGGVSFVQVGVNPDYHIEIRKKQNTAPR